MDIVGAYQKVQEEETEFRSSISEGVITKAGAIINKAIDETTSLPLGTIEMSMMTEVQFQGLRNSGWVLCDGQSIVGSALATLTGQTTAPDSRARFLRGKDNARGLDPNGDSSLGAQRASTTKTHAHASTLTNVDGCATAVTSKFCDDDNDMPGVWPADLSAAISITINAEGLAEARPDNVTVNFFIRIN